MVLLNSHRLVYPMVLGNNIQGVCFFSLTGLLPSLVFFSKLVKLRNRFVTPRQTVHPSDVVPRHHSYNAHCFNVWMVWAVPVSLAATWGIAIWLASDYVAFFSSGYWDGSLLPVVSHILFYSDVSDRAFPLSGCPIRGSPGLSLLTTHRSLSQLTTPFIVFWRQGIHHKPLVAWSQVFADYFGYPCYNMQLLKIKSSVKLKYSKKYSSLTHISNYILELSFIFLNYYIFELSSLVETSGIEPPTSYLQGRRSPIWATSPR